MSLDVHNSFFLVWSDGLVLGYIQRPSKTNGLKEDCQNGVLQGCRGCTLNSQHFGMRMIHMTYLMNILRLIAWNFLVRLRLTSFFSAFKPEGVIRSFRSWRVTSRWLKPCSQWIRRFWWWYGVLQAFTDQWHFPASWPMFGYYVSCSHWNHRCLSWCLGGLQT